MRFWVRSEQNGVHILVFRHNAKVNLKLRRQNKRNRSERGAPSPNECCFVKIANSQRCVRGDWNWHTSVRFYWARRAALKNVYCEREVTAPSPLRICIVFNSRVGASHFCCFQLNSNFFRLFSTQPCSRASSCSVLRGHTSSWRFQLSHCNSLARVLALQLCFASASLS